jgi:predicted transcriptional regulator
MDMREIMELCKLTEEEMAEYLQLTKNIDHKEDHSRAYRTMMNQTRRELLKFIGTNIRNFEEIENNFEEETDTLNYHLSMLEQLYYVMNTKAGWKATPRGIGFLNNAIMGD